jgi:hypothetical protein
MELAIDSSTSPPDLPKALCEELRAAIRGSVYPRNDAKYAQFHFLKLRKLTAFVLVSWNFRKCLMAMRRLRPQWLFVRLMRKM